MVTVATIIVVLFCLVVVVLVSLVLSYELTTRDKE